MKHWKKKGSKKLNILNTEIIKSPKRQQGGFLDWVAAAGAAAEFRLQCEVLGALLNDALQLFLFSHSSATASSIINMFFSRSSVWHSLHPAPPSCDVESNTAAAEAPTQLKNLVFARVSGQSYVVVAELGKQCPRATLHPRTHTWSYCVHFVLHNDFAFFNRVGWKVTFLWCIPSSFDRRRLPWLIDFQMLWWVSI